MNYLNTNQPMVSLSFDDGRKDTYDIAFKIMQKYGLVATLHITTGWIDGTFEPKDWLSAQEGAMSIQEIQTCYNSGFEITSHGDKHLLEKKDLQLSINKLKQWQVVNDTYLGFSFPNSQIGADSEEILKKANIKYGRAGRSHACYSLYGKICYVLQNNFHFKKAFYAFNHYNNIIAPIQDLYHLPSTVIKSTNTANQVIYFLEQSMKNNSWNILMLHSILNPEQRGYGRDCWYWSADEFENLCKWLSHQNQIKVVTIEEGVKQCMQKNGQLLQKSNAKQ